MNILVCSIGLTSGVWLLLGYDGAGVLNGFVFCLFVVVGVCLGTTFLVVFWVVFGCWVVVFGLFGCGLSWFVSLLYVGVCCVFWVVVVAAC